MVSQEEFEKQYKADEHELLCDVEGSKIVPNQFQVTWHDQEIWWEHHLALMPLRARRLPSGKFELLGPPNVIDEYLSKGHNVPMLETFLCNDPERWFWINYYDCLESGSLYNKKYMRSSAGNIEQGYAFWKAAKELFGYADDAKACYELADLLKFDEDQNTACYWLTYFDKNMDPDYWKSNEVDWPEFRRQLLTEFNWKEAQRAFTDTVNRMGAVRRS